MVRLTRSVPQMTDLEQQLTDALLRLEMEARRVQLQLVLTAALVLAGTAACLLRMTLGIDPDAPPPVLMAWFAVVAISLGAMIGLIFSARRLQVLNKLTRELNVDLRRLRRRG